MGIVQEVLSVVRKMDEGVDYSLSMVRGDKTIFIKNCKSEKAAKKLASDLDFDPSWRPRIEKVRSKPGKILYKDLIQ